MVLPISRTVLTTLLSGKSSVTTSHQQIATRLIFF
jgi:hypothetical protein